MTRFKKHSVLSIVTHLVITGFMMGVLFGQGSHLHRLLVQAGNQIDATLSFHAHSSHDDLHAHHHDPKQEKDKHQHEVATFDIDGITAPPTNFCTDLKVQAGVILLERTNNQMSLLKDSVLRLNLPPPLSTKSDSYLSSFSFRGPPAA